MTQTLYVLEKKQILDDLLEYYTKLLSNDKELLAAAIRGGKRIPALDEQSMDELADLFTNLQLGEKYAKLHNANLVGIYIRATTLKIVYVKESNLSEHRESHVDPIARTNEEIDNAIRVLLDAEYLETGDETLVLLANPSKSVYYTPQVVTIGSDSGKIEHMISDGIAGQRSNGSSFDTFAEAIRFFYEVSEKGWEESLRNCT
jgi:hypothetical protein